MDTILQRNHVNILGNPNGETILFANGYGCDQSMWRFIYPSLEMKYRIILYDNTGAGQSNINYYSFEKHSSLLGHAEDMLDIIEATGSKDVILIAHSVSCMVGVLASIEKPYLFKKLILIGPSPCYINDEKTKYYGGFTKEDIDALMDALDDNYLGWVSTVTPIIMGNPDRQELTDELSNMFCRNHPDIAKHYAKVTFYSDNRDDLPKVTVPSYIIQSEVDAIASIKVGEYVASKIPNSKYYLIPSVGHCPHLSHPTETLEVLNQILQD